MFLFQRTAFLCMFLEPRSLLIFFRHLLLLSLCCILSGHAFWANLLKTRFLFLFINVQGGGFSIYSSTVSLVSCTISENTAVRSLLLLSIYLFQRTAFLCMCRSSHVFFFLVCGSVYYCAHYVACFLLAFKKPISILISVREPFGFFTELQLTFTFLSMLCLICVSTADRAWRRVVSVAFRE